MTAIIPTSNHSAKLVKKAFGNDGALAKAISGFSPRQAQTDMAIDVADAIDNQSSLIVEAGTGTGKTFAYLIPAFLSLDPKKPKKIMVSTGTKNLQEQLFHKDIPLIKKALASNAQVALLKGRANYLLTSRRLNSIQKAVTILICSVKISGFKFWPLF